MRLRRPSLSKLMEMRTWAPLHRPRSADMNTVSQAALRVSPGAAPASPGNARGLIKRDLGFQNCLMIAGMGKFQPDSLDCLLEVYRPQLSPQRSPSTGQGNACSAAFIVYLNCEPFNIDLAAWGTAAGSRVWLTAITF